ncbi:MAG: hypothetical protein M3O50_13115 [Myxococcota bacterium]|nr:hypothetical protein [Myxococcota bacterium]
MRRSGGPDPGATFTCHLTILRVLAVPSGHFIMSIARCIARVVVGCVLLAAPSARAADESVNEEARRHFNAGVTLLQDPDGARYEDAFREFEAAYAASLSPKILGNIGYCALKLERDGDALRAYTRYLQEVPDVDPAEAAQINRDLATLRAGLVRVTVSADTPGWTVVDKRLPVRGESITNLYGPLNGKLEIGLRPGHHSIEIRAHGELMGPWDFDAAPGSTWQRTFYHEVATQGMHKRSSTTLPWVITGVGAASLVAGGVVGALTLTKVNAIASNCPNNTCPATYALKPAQDDARHLVPIADALLIGGAVVAATGLGLVLWSGGTVATTAPQSARASAFCLSSGCMAAMSGSF